MHPVFLVYFMFLTNLSMGMLVYYLLFKKQELTSLQINQIKFMLIAFAIYSVACVDFVPNYGIEIYPFGYIPTFIFIFVIGFTIVRYRLMDIRIVLTRIGIFAGVYVVLLGIPFLIGYSTRQWILAAVMLAAFAGVGPFVFRYLQSRADAVLFQRNRQYQKILRAASEEILKYKDKREVVDKLVELMYGNVKVSFVGVYLRECDMFICKGKQPKEASLPEKVGVGDSLIEGLRERKVLHDSALGREAIPLVLGIGNKEELEGFIAIGEKADKGIYSSEDIETFETLLNQVLLALENIQHIEDCLLYTSPSPRD